MSRFGWGVRDGAEPATTGYDPRTGVALPGPRREMPKQAVAFAVLLLAAGFSCLAAGLALGAQGTANATALFVLGALMFTPGVYYSFLSFKAWRKADGFSFDALPELQAASRGAFARLMLPAPALQERASGASAPCRAPVAAALRTDCAGKENAPSMADDDDEWTPSESQAADSQASEAAPARRRLRKKGESQAALSSAASWEPEVASPAAPAVLPVVAEPEVVCASAIAAPSADAEAVATPAERATPSTPTPALTPSRMDWARGFAASAGATLLGGLLRRFSLSPLPRAPPAAPSPLASPPLEEEPQEAQPVQRRRLRKKRSLEAAASQLLPPDEQEPSSPAPPASPIADDGDALADALAGVTLAPTVARVAPPAVSPPAPPPVAKSALPRAAVSSSSSSESSSDDSSSDDDASEDSSSDDDAPRPAQRPAPRTAQPASRDAAPRNGPLVAVGDDEAAAEGAAQPQRMEFTDAATGARFVLSAKLSARLFAHQREGVAWLWGRHILGRGGILGDDMGLGKTFQVAAFLSGLLRGGAATRALVVAPTTLQAQWMSELERCGLGGSTHSFGDRGDRAAALAAVRKHGGVLLTSYGMVQHNAGSLGAPRRLLKDDDAAASAANDSGDDDDEDNSHPRWDWVICDEGHKLKNPRMQLVARLMAVPAARRLLLTGTPVQNNLSELWALFNIVTPGLLGDAREFRDEFDKPIARGQSREASAREREHGAAKTVALQKKIAPAFLRREKSTVLAPPKPAAEGEQVEAAGSAPTPLGHKSDMIVWLRLTQPQRRLYAAFLGSSSVAAALNKTGSALAALTVLKKICDHPGLLSHNAAAEIARGRPLASVVAGGESAPSGDDDAACDGDSGGAPAGASDPAASCKTAFVLSLVAAVAAEGHRVLVFSQSRAMLDGIQAAAEAASWRFCRIDGTVPASERARRVAAFQSDAGIPLFLLTSAVGGVGLTLTGADRVVVLDPSWNPAADAQAVDRAYRMGQTRDVAVYRLITCGTVEEKIYRKQVFKAGLSRAGTGGADVARYFTSDQLRDLFAWEPAALDASATAASLTERHGPGGAGAPPAVADELARIVRTHPAVAAVTDHNALFSAPDDTAPGVGVGGSPPSRGGAISVQPGGGVGSKMPTPGPKASGGGWRGGGANAWRGSDQGGLIARAMAHKPSSALSSADSAAAKQAARINEVVASIERYDRLLSDPTLKPPDGGAMLRTKRDKLAAELTELRAASSAQPLEASQASQAAASDDLADALGAFSL